MRQRHFSLLVCGISLMRIMRGRAESFSKIIALDPENAPANYELAVISFRQKMQASEVRLQSEKRLL